MDRDRGQRYFAVIALRSWGSRNSIGRVKPFLTDRIEVFNRRRKKLLRLSKNCRNASEQANIMTILERQDPDVWQAIQGERRRQQQGLEMIASENYTSPAVMAAQGSVLTNKYAEGYPGRRYYGGCEFVDTVERLGHRPRAASYSAPKRPTSSRIPALRRIWPCSSPHSNRATPF